MRTRSTFVSGSPQEGCAEGRSVAPLSYACYGVVVVVAGAWGEPPAWSCLSFSCGAAVDPAVEQAQTWTLTLPLTIRFAVVFSNCLPVGPDAFLTFSAIVPPAT